MIFKMIDFSKFDELEFNVRKCAEVQNKIINLFSENNMSDAEAKHTLNSLLDFYRLKYFLK